jgi:hypothetical protein
MPVWSIILYVSMHVWISESLCLYEFQFTLLYVYACISDSVNFSFNLLPVWLYDLGYVIWELIQDFQFNWSSVYVLICMACRAGSAHGMPGNWASTAWIYLRRAVVGPNSGHVGRHSPLYYPGRAGPFS